MEGITLTYWADKFRKQEKEQKNKMVEVTRYMAGDGKVFKSREEAEKHDEKVNELYLMYEDRYKAIMRRAVEEYDFWAEATDGYAHGCCDTLSLIFTPKSELDKEMLNAMADCENVKIGTTYLITDVERDATYISEWESLKESIKSNLDRL